MSPFQWYAFRPTPFPATKSLLQPLSKSAECDSLAPVQQQRHCSVSYFPCQTMPTHKIRHKALPKSDFASHFSDMPTPRLPILLLPNDTAPPIHFQHRSASCPKTQIPTSKKLPLLRQRKWLLQHRQCFPFPWQLPTLRNTFSIVLHRLPDGTVCRTSVGKSYGFQKSEKNACEY